MNKRNELAKQPESFINTLFFQARNLAIEVLLLNLKNLFRENNFNISEVNWKESSFTSPYIEIILKNNKSNQSWTEADFKIFINREKIKIYTNHISDCYYSFHSIMSPYGYNRNNQLKSFNDFINEFFNSQENKKMIENVNYPFDRKYYSSF